MRLPNYRIRREGENTAMTSMIDVVFLLLIFFVCAASGFVTEKHLATELAAGSVAVSDVPPPQRPLGEGWLKLASADTGELVVEVNGRSYTNFDRLTDVIRQLADLAPEIPVILDIAPRTPMGDVIRVYDLCRSANFEDVQFAADAAAIEKPVRG